MFFFLLCYGCCFAYSFISNRNLGFCASSCAIVRSDILIPFCAAPDALEFANETNLLEVISSYRYSDETNSFGEKQNTDSLIFQLDGVS